MNIYILIIFLALLAYFIYNSYEKFTVESLLDEENLESNKFDEEIVKRKSGDLYKKSFFDLNSYRDTLLKPSKNYIDDVTNLHFDKYGQIYDKSFNLDDIKDLDDKTKQELKDKNYLDTKQFPSHNTSMEGLNYKKALLDTCRIQAIEDKHFSKLDQLLN